MARIVNYQQIAGAPYGVGTATLDDGTEVTIDDPDRMTRWLEDEDERKKAAQGSLTRSVATETNELLARPEERYQNAVARLAGGPDAPQVELKPRLERPDPMRGAVAGAGGGEPLESRQPDEVLESREPEPPRTPSPAETRESVAAERAAGVASLVSPYKVTKGVDPRRMQREGVAVDKSFSRKGGLPEDVYAQQAEDRATMFTAEQDLSRRQWAEDQAARDLETERLRGEAAALKKSNDQQALQIARREEKYKADRDWLEKDVEAWYERKPSPDGGLRQRRGVLGNLASAIAQFMGTYAAIISGSPNFANQILNRKIDASVDAEAEEFRRGKVKRDGQLARMVERGMSLEQAKSALKIQHEIAIKREVEARANEEGTRNAKQAAQSLLMDRASRFVSEEQKFQREALGEQTVSGEFVQPQAGGRVAKTPLEIAKEQTDLLALRNRFEYEARGGEVAERAEDRATKRSDRAEDMQLKRDELAMRREEHDAKRQDEQGRLTDSQAKAEAAHQGVTALGTKAGLVRDKSGKWVVGGGALPPGFVQGVGETITGGIYQGDIAPAFDAAVEAFGRQQSGGVIGTDERPAFETQLGKQTMTRQQLADRLNAAEVNIEAKRKQDVDDIRTGRVNAAPKRWKSKDDEDED